MWLLQHLHEELNDEKADAFTSGFGDGYKKGFEEAGNRAKERETFWMEQVKKSEEYLPMDLRLNLDGVIEAKPVNGSITLSLGGRTLDSEEVSVLKQESDALLRSRLWAIMQETVKQKAIDKTVRESTNWEQALAGKMMIHSLGLLKSIVDAVERASVPSEQNK